MKIELTVDEMKGLQNHEALERETRRNGNLESTNSKLHDETWTLRDTVRNLQFRLTEAEERNRRLADNEARYQNQPHMDPDTRVRYLSVGNRKKLDAIISFINNKQKINAIKAYRELTGLGLKESKDAIEAW